MYVLDVMVKPISPPLAEIRGATPDRPQTVGTLKGKPSGSDRLTSNGVIVTTFSAVSGP